MQNLRDYVNAALELNSDDTISSYADIVREERYFCAVLFHCMLQDPEGMQEFLTKCGVKEGNSEVKGVFVEYAMVRDLWECLNKRGTKAPDRNPRKREWIINMLCRDPSDSATNTCRHHLSSLDIPSFNKLFVAGNVSPKHIESPSRWGIGGICNSHEVIGTELLKRACMLKWAFNSKPDIVVELANDTVVCIEAKVESKEGVYANSKSDRQALNNILAKAQVQGTDLQELKVWFEKNANQIAVQKYVMKDLLGYAEVHEIFLDNISEDNLGNKKLSWKTALSCFSDTSHPTVAAANNRLEQLSR